MTLLNQTWDFFASVKLAIFTLCSLAITSIIGTIIPQGESTSFYISKYGPKVAQFMRVLDIPEMYYSWWFLGLLGILSCNLIICSVDRFPRVWRVIHSDNLSISRERLSKMTNSTTWQEVPTKLYKDIPTLLSILGLSGQTKNIEGGTLTFKQKGKWSRTGVYIVHLSILVIFVGAIVGHFKGFKGSVMIPELASTKKVFNSKDQSSIDLGFEIRCNKFIIDFYDNGMPKEYESSLTVLENDKEVLTRNIEVNGPLTYKGITFYQSSYQGYQDFVFTITDKSRETTKTLTVPFQQKKSWQKEDLHFGIINAEAIGQRVVRSKVWMKAGKNKAVIEWLDDNNSTVLKAGDREYIVHAKQMYATGLQVAKDPGVWIVYIGCGLMMIGLYMAFFMSHRRIWLFFADENADTASITLAGNANKNRAAFSEQFRDIEKRLNKIFKE